MNSYSPTFLSVVGSLAGAGYSYSDAKSYGRKIFLMDRFIHTFYGKKRREVDMRNKRVLAVILLAGGLCFVPAMGYGEIQSSLYKSEGESMELRLLRARLDYIMSNPTIFLDVDFHYDVEGVWEDEFPEGVTTQGKIVVVIYDSRGRFTDKPSLLLLNEFRMTLEVLYSYIESVATNMYADIVSKLYTEDEIPLGCFYRGVYELWEK